MNSLPSHLKYALTHEWAQLEKNQLVQVGITNFAQEQLGDIVYVELPQIGTVVSAQQACATVESVKTASDIHSPVSGEIVAINESLNDSPEQINDDAYKTWLFFVKATDLQELETLLDASAYQQQIDE